MNDDVGFNFGDYVLTVPSKRYTAKRLHRTFLARCVYVKNFSGSSEDAKKDVNYFSFKELIYWMQVGAYLRSKGKI